MDDVFDSLGEMIEWGVDDYDHYAVDDDNDDDCVDDDDDDDGQMMMASACVSEGIV